MREPSNKNFNKLRSGLPTGLLRPITIGLIILLPLSFILIECSGGGGGSQPDLPQVITPEPEPEPFSELVQQGVTKYLGSYTPMLAEEDNGAVTHSFGGGSGPLCFDGSEYRMSTRDMGSEDLMIFLQGGGACWSDICSCNETAQAGIPKDGILDPDLAQNPLKSWNLVFLPYCDGSHFAGDIDLDMEQDGVIDRCHRGLKNLSSALDVTVNLFPAPRRILLAGVSAGGFGTLYALPLVRHLYPKVPIYIINDSGVGILPPGTIAKMFKEWQALGFLPESCVDCLDENGHLINYYLWLLAEDKNLVLGMMSYNRDPVIADGFSDMGADLFEQYLVADMEKLVESYPNRTSVFIAEGAWHTFLLGSLAPTADGMTVADWIAALTEKTAD